MSEEKTIWLLKHARAGDLAQMRHLASMLREAMNCTVEEKQLVFRHSWLVKGPGGARRLLDWHKSNIVAPPWPDAILVAEAVATGIAAEIKSRAGGRSRVIVVGRPAGHTAKFDLVLTTAQYGLPQAANIVTLPLPLAAVPTVAKYEHHEFLRRMEGRPRPWLAVLIGGGVPPDSLDEQAIARLAEAALKERELRGGSLVILTSPRTGGGSEQLLRDKLGTADLLQTWIGLAKPNLYGAALAEADRFIVTSDSISMAVEAVNTGKPVSVFMLPQRIPLGFKLLAALDSHAGLGVSCPSPIWYPVSILFKRGILELPANRPRFYRELAERGVLAFYPDFPAKPGTGLLAESRAVAVSAVRKLLA